MAETTTVQAAPSDYSHQVYLMRCSAIVGRKGACCGNCNQPITTGDAGVHWQCPQCGVRLQYCIQDYHDSAVPIDDTKKELEESFPGLQFLGFGFGTAQRGVVHRLELV